MNNNAYIILPQAITVVVDGKPYSVNAANKGLYDAVKQLIKDGKFSEIPDTIDRLSAVAKKVAAHNATKPDSRLVVRNRRVYSIDPDGTEHRLHGYEINKLLELMDQGFDIGPISAFAQRVRNNPSEAVRARLYEFMEYGNLPLTADGSFVAYKVVNPDYKDKHTRTFDNRIGQTPKMKREDVDDNDNNTCSRGLHVCSKDYVKSFLTSSRDHLMVVVVAPEDVVSIPTDYNNTKMRTAKYHVIGEVKETDDPAFFGKAVLSQPESDIEFD